MADAPIVLISSFPPRRCDVGMFAEEAREFIASHNPGRDVLVVSHADGAGEGVLPLIDMANPSWWRPVAETLHDLQPHVVHIQHDYPLYNYIDKRGVSDNNAGVLNLLEAISDLPTVIEPHTIHGRFTEREADFVYRMCERADVVLVKCHYQKWRMDWSFSDRRWPTPLNIMVVPHGSRSDQRYSLAEVVELKQELGLDKVEYLSSHLVGLVGWIKSNKRWDILTKMWEEIVEEVHQRTGKDWDLLAAGTLGDAAHKEDYVRWRSEVEFLERRKVAHYYEFVPRGEQYYKMLAVCDFIVLPTTDDTQSGTLARIVALNKPFITTAPMEGLTAQALESGGGLLFTNREMLKQQVIDMCCNRNLRMELGNNLKDYLENVVSWDVVAEQYNEAYSLARHATQTGKSVILPKEF